MTNSVSYCVESISQIAQHRSVIRHFRAMWISHSSFSRNMDWSHVGHSSFRALLFPVV